MASIFSLALSTVEAFKRKLSKCEMIEYLEYTKHDDLIRIKQMLGNPSCESMSSIWDDDEWDQFKDFYYDDDDEKTDVATTWETSRETTEITTEQTKTTNFSPTSGGGGGVGSGGGAGGGGKSPSPLPIESSVPSVMLSTTESLDDQDKYHDDDSGEDDHSPPRHMRILIPDLRTTIKAFDFINIILMVCFSLDLLLRLVSCPSVLRYFLSVVNILDAIALVGTYIYVIVTEIKKDQKYVDNWLDVIEYLQILRTLRLFRLVKNVRATKVLVYAVKQSFKDLLILLMFLFIAVCTFASIVYFAESRDEFESIPTGWWWALVTLTTVGYGDVYPKTWVGRAVASACALTGVVLIALTLPIFVNNFLTLYQYAMVEEVLQGKQQRQEAQNTKETVSKIDVTPVNGVKTDAVMSKTNGNALTLASE